MELYSTEEQQAEELQKFWKQNGKTIIIGIIMGVIGILGWEQFKSYRQGVMEENTYTYMTVIKNLNADYNENTVKATEKLIKDQDGSIYAELAAFNLATLAVDQKNDIEKAMVNLEISAKSSDDALASISKLRLARVYAQEQRFDDAYKLLNELNDEIYGATVSELVGDFKLLQGKNDEARAAYQKAYDKIKDTQEIQHNQLLKIKLDDLNGSAAAAKTEVKTEVKPEANTEAKPEVKPEAKTEADAK